MAGFGGGGFGNELGASQFAGGGFMPSPAGADASGFGKGSKSKQDQTLRAVTVKQLVRDTAHTDDDTHRVDDVEISTITLVGKVLHQSDNGARLNLKLHDGTGIIEVSQWLNEDQDQNQLRTDARVGAYVRVFGNVRSFEKKKSMQAYSIKPIVDFNEVTHHYLQVIFQQVHLHSTKGSACGPSGAAVGATGQGPAARGQWGGAQQHAAGGQSGGTIHEDVMSIFNKAELNNSDNGLSNNDVVQLMKSGGSVHTPQQILAAIDFLTNEGHIYSTIDEEHHKSAQI